MLKRTIFRERLFSMNIFIITMQEFREITGIKWENNIIVGVNLKTSSGGSYSQIYKTLKELHDESIENEVNTKLGKRTAIENPVLTLPYIREEDGGTVSKFVYVVKIGSQYEIRDVKDQDIPKSLLELEKI